MGSSSQKFEPALMEIARIANISLQLGYRLDRRPPHYQG
jgi:hypothetical protein